MNEPIVVDMALAFQQMKDNPQLVDMFNELLQLSAPKYEEVFDGWVVRTRSRKLDADKNPISDWHTSYRSASRSCNPYVYQKGRHYSKNQVRENIIYDNSGAPHRHNDARYGTPEYNEWYADYLKWSDARPIVGYWQYETRVLPAKIVVEAE